ncbi:MAG: response regulator transcription factor [Anaerolineae bacterium]|jgi:DNA-binding NarL/FixJ family response regulator
MSVIRLLIVDDQEIIRQGLSIILGHQPDIEVVGLASDGAEGVRLARELRPDVVLMDIKMPGMNGIQATGQITLSLPETSVIILTTYDVDDWVFDCIRAGAIGYILKDAKSDTLAEAVRGAVRGESQIDPAVARKVLTAFRHLDTSAPDDQSTSQRENKLPPLERLTEREQEVLDLLAEGLSNKEIAARLTLSEGTIKNHVSNILSKLHANDRTQAVLTAIRRGLVDI